MFSVAGTNVVPLSGNGWSNRVWMEGSDSRAAVNRNWSRISPSYFRTLGIPLLSGREFDERDSPTSRKVAIVNEAFAKQVALTSNPVGLTFWQEATPSAPETAYEIVGLVGNTKYETLREPPQPLFYLPLSQDPAPQPTGQLLIRSDLPLKTLLPSFQRAILAADAEAHFDIYNFEDLIHAMLARERLMATLSTIFAVLATLLSSVGLYGVITYIVMRRTSEIGIRIALGADRTRIFGMLLFESGKMMLTGLLVGVALTFGAATLVSKILFGLTPHDPIALTLSITSLLLVGVLATLLPALRAANTDPAAALREE